MTPFTAPIDNILFSMENVAGAGELPGWDGELARQILIHFAQLAQDRIAPLNQPGDRQGCRLIEGTVRMPDGFAEAFKDLSDGGWQGLTAPEAFGGMGQGHLIAGAVSEVFSGANHAMQMVCNLVPGAIRTLLLFGTKTQQATWIPKLASGEALSTMCLTEAGAGSDLSRIRTSAVRNGDNWTLHGEKIFISGGDQDMSPDILHLVLAHTGGNEDGVEGLSLFLCSKANAGPTITIPRIEEKLGVHASPTCQMVFDATPAELIGQEGGGLKAMFTVMNHARIDVALQGVAHAARAHAIAQDYAAERVQGRKPDGTDARLSDHADIRRMLDEQRRLELGARAMVHVALVEIEKGERPDLIDFLTPLCKVFCSNAGIRAADLGIQILGGYGYLEDYSMAQIWRDARITAIYEGANGIHARSLATRGLRLNGGKGADQFDTLIAELSDHQATLHQRNVWRTIRKQVSAASDPSQLAHVFTKTTANLLYRALWDKIARVGDDPELRRLHQALTVDTTTDFAAPSPILEPTD